MKSSSDPIIHRQREQQMIQHMEKLLGDERLRVPTRMGRRPVTAFVREVSRSDRAVDLKRLMTEMNRPDRALQNQMPIGETLEVALTQTRWFFFNQTVGRVRVICLSPTRALLAGETPPPMNAADVSRTLSSLPPSLGGAPVTTILACTAGFSPDALGLAKAAPEQTVILVEPNDSGGWNTAAPPEARGIAELLDPEPDAGKRQRVFDLIRENQVDLLTSGIATDKLSAKAQLPASLVESVLKDYARANPGLIAKRLDGRVVLFREGSGALSPLASVSGGSMGLIEKVRALFSHKGDNEKKILYLSERKTALSQQRDRAYEDMAALEEQESSLKQQFKDAAGAITKRRVTGQMLQLRKDLERRQQLLSMLNQQINVVSTHLHNLELVQQGQGARLPDTDEITEDAVKAEEMLAQLEADSELAGSVGQIGTTGMSEEEKALFEELEKETADAEAPAPAVAEKPARLATAPREPAARDTPMREAQPADVPAPARRAKPEAG